MERSARSNVISIWPTYGRLFKTREFVALLSAREEEASVVALAHYGALIHPHHDKWVFGDGDQILNESVQVYLMDRLVRIAATDASGNSPERK
ncbi:uncharacterized protein N7483_006333 [Penicillium malachiteum]|uniref:uncharacterized protein n=1 Tax=Penicillium malachiteum TaxID=1324776 RepID=UPI002547FCAB|nr:uncharacterized protein N7483_006333 [Penicillium malachiteum]KAJ5724976.1 hypothetical protein N7483_006333 [Penicillium malachiteum]